MPGVDGSPHRGMSQRLRHHLSASVFVALWRSSEVCMLRRIGTGWMDGSFSIPAGALESGETIRMAAVREAHEEVGVRINPHDLVYVHTLHSLTAGNDWVGRPFLHRAGLGRDTADLRAGEAQRYCLVPCRVPSRTNDPLRSAGLALHRCRIDLFGIWLERLTPACLAGFGYSRHLAVRPWTIAFHLPGWRFILHRKFDLGAKTSGPLTGRPLPRGCGPAFQPTSEIWRAALHSITFA